MHKDKELGSVTVGKFADMILISGDPTKQHKRHSPRGGGDQERRCLSARRDVSSLWHTRGISVQPATRES